MIIRVKEMISLVKENIIRVREIVSLVKEMIF